MTDLTSLAIRKSATTLFNAMSKRIQATQRKAIGRNGQEVTDQIKEWYGVTTSINGQYSFDYSAVGFKEILHVDPRAVHDSPYANEQAMATINTVSLNSVRGRVVKGTTGIFKSDALTFLPVCTVMVKVIGVV